MWRHVKNYAKGAVACLHQEGGITGIMFSHQTAGPITGWAYSGRAYNRDFTGVCQVRSISQLEATLPTQHWKKPPLSFSRKLQTFSLKSLCSV